MPSIILYICALFKKNSRDEAQNKRLPRGRPLARGTGAAADRGRESEGGIRAMTSGNRAPLDPAEHRRPVLM